MNEIVPKHRVEWASYLHIILVSSILHLFDHYLARFISGLALRRVLGCGFDRMIFVLDCNLGILHCLESASFILGNLFILVILSHYDGTKLVRFVGAPTVYIVVIPSKCMCLTGGNVID